MKAGRISPTFSGYLLAAFLPAFFVAMTFFVLVLEMGDLFINLVQYLQNDVPPAAILRIFALYLPKCLSWALPIATLFTVSYVLGTMYANNELMAVFASGVSLGAFALPLVVMAGAMSLGFLVFEDRVVIPSLAAKKELAKTFIQTGSQGVSPTDLTIMGDGGRLVWSVRYFDALNDSLSGVVVVERDASGGFVSRINAQSAAWNGSFWEFSGVRRFFWRGEYLSDETIGQWSDERYAEPPDSFRGGGKPVEEMTLAGARLQIAFLLNAGLPSVAARAEYYRRFSFSLTPLVVTMLSIALVGRFRKNVLLMSLLVSLVGATLYYVAQMISMLLAKSDAVSPLAGAFAPILIFTALSLALLKLRKV